MENKSTSVAFVLCATLYTQTHKKNVQFSPYTLQSLDAAAHQLAVVFSVRGDSINFTYTHHAYWFTFFSGVVIGMNGLSDLITGVVQKPGCKTMH